VRAGWQRGKRKGVRAGSKIAKGKEQRAERRNPGGSREHGGKNRDPRSEVRGQTSARARGQRAAGNFGFRIADLGFGLTSDF
jgi:hypothetical protein